MNLSPTDTLKIAGSLAGIAGCRFASFAYTSKETNETARHTVALGFDYMELVSKSLAKLIQKRKKLAGVDAIAADELIASFQATLNGTQTGYTKAEIYLPTTIRGLKVNTNDGSLQLFGLAMSKKIIIPGNPRKPVNSAPKTIAKNALRKDLPIGKFREFALDSGNLHTANIKGRTLTFA